MNSNIFRREERDAYNFCLDFAEYQWYKYTKKPVKESKYLLPDVTENRRWWKGGTKSRWEWAPEGERNCQEGFRRRTKTIGRGAVRKFSVKILSMQAGEDTPLSKSAYRLCMH